MEKVFARDWFTFPLSVAVARTSQSPFPLYAMFDKHTADKIHKKNTLKFYRKLYFYEFNNILN